MTDYIFSIVSIDRLHASTEFFQTRSIIIYTLVLVFFFLLLVKKGRREKLEWLPYLVVTLVILARWELMRGHCFRKQGMQTIHEPEAAGVEIIPSIPLSGLDTWTYFLPNKLG